MAEMCALYLWFLMALLGAWIVADFIRGKHDLLSFRNLFLAGFMLNQLHSPADTLWFDNWWAFRVDNHDAVGMECCVLTTIYLVVFIVSYRWGWGVKGVANKIKVPEFNPTPSQLLAFAAVVTGVAFALRAGFHVLPFILAILSYRAAIGLCAVSCGLIGWAIGRKMWNPAFLGYGLAVIALNLAIATTGFSRRPFVAVFAALIWGFYYSYWRYQRPTGVMIKLVVMAIPPILIVATFSSIRESGDADRSLSRVFNRMLTKSDPLKGLQKLASGDSTGPAELWTIENFNERFEPRHLFSLRFFFMLNIPRAIWPDKPVTLGNQIPTFIRMDGVDLKVMSIPPGIVGFGAGEGGVYAVIIYAVISAVFLRFFDQVLCNNVLNPFFVVALAADMGQVLGLARGDCSLFAHSLLTSIMFAMVITLCLAWALAKRGVPQPPSFYRTWELATVPAAPQRQTITVWVPAEWVAQQQRRNS